MNFQLANSNKDTLRAACKKCGYAGHLTYQCRNFLKVSKANAAKRTYLSTIATTTERRREEKERIEIIINTRYVTLRSFLALFPSLRWIRTKRFCWTWKVPVRTRSSITWRRLPSCAHRSWKAMPTLHPPRQWRGQQQQMPQRNHHHRLAKWIRRAAAAAAVASGIITTNQPQYQRQRKARKPIGIRSARERARSTRAARVAVALATAMGVLCPVTIKPKSVREAARMSLRRIRSRRRVVAKNQNVVAAQPQAAAAAQAHHHHHPHHRRRHRIHLTTRRLRAAIQSPIPVTTRSRAQANQMNMDAKRNVWVNINAKRKRQRPVARRQRPSVGGIALAVPVYPAPAVTSAASATAAPTSNDSNNSNNNSSNYPKHSTAFSFKLNKSNLG